MNDSRTKPEQAAVIPVRRVADGVVQVCLIRRKNSAKWSIPKGYIDRGHDQTQAALAEASEEAGLDGRLVGDSIGMYEYDKGPIRLTVAVFVMDVLQERPTWREMRWRERRWCSIEEAGTLLRSHQVRSLYDLVRPRLATLSPDTSLQPPSGGEGEQRLRPERRR